MTENGGLAQHLQHLRSDDDRRAFREYRVDRPTDNCSPKAFLEWSRVKAQAQQDLDTRRIVDLLTL